jgi:hypothetical protein
MELQRPPETNRTSSFQQASGVIVTLLSGIIPPPFEKTLPLSFLYLARRLVATSNVAKFSMSQNLRQKNRTFPVGFHAFKNAGASGFLQIIPDAARNPSG